MSSKADKVIWPSKSKTIVLQTKTVRDEIAARIYYVNEFSRRLFSHNPMRFLSRHMVEYYDCQDDADLYHIFQANIRLIHMVKLHHFYT